MKVNGNRVWQVTTDHSIGLGGERKTEELANELTNILDTNGMKNLVKYSEYRVTIEIFTFKSMCLVVEELDHIMQEDKYKLTGIKVETSKY